jgi:hypothetical protein
VRHTARSERVCSNNEEEREQGGADGHSGRARSECEAAMRMTGVRSNDHDGDQEVSWAKQDLCQDAQRLPPS